MWFRRRMEWQRCWRVTLMLSQALVRNLAKGSSFRVPTTNLDFVAQWRQVGGVPAGCPSWPDVGGILTQCQTTSTSGHSTEWPLGSLDWIWGDVPIFCGLIISRIYPIQYMFLRPTSRIHRDLGQKARRSWWDGSFALRSLTVKKCWRPSMPSPGKVDGDRHWKV